MEAAKILQIVSIEFPIYLSTLSVKFTFAFLEEMQSEPVFCPGDGELFVLLTLKSIWTKRILGPTFTT